MLQREARTRVASAENDGAMVARDGALPARPDPKKTPSGNTSDRNAARATGGNR